MDFFIVMKIGFAYEVRIMSFHFEPLKVLVGDF